MAFDISGLRLISGKSMGKPGTNTYAYTTADLKATIETSGYFNNVAPYSLGEGDIILVTIDNDGTIDTMTLVVSDVTSGVVTTTESATAEAASGGTSGQMAKFDANGRPADATNTDTQVSGAVTNSHTRAHAITGTSDHTSTATAAQMLKADANGLPVDATNTDAEVSAAVTRAGKIYLWGEIADISTAASSWTVSPAAGTITNIWTVIDGAITVADATITFEIGGTAVTGGSITIAYSGSAAGTVDTCAPTAQNTLAAGGALEIITDGGSTDAAKAVVCIELTLS